MLVHCNSKVRPYVSWFLAPNHSFHNRSIEFGHCPHCNKEFARLVEYRKSDGLVFSKNFKWYDLDKLREEYKSEVEYKSTDLYSEKGSPCGWVYGENKSTVDKKTGEVIYTQRACDFYGNKEIVKKFRQA